MSALPRNLLPQPEVERDRVSRNLLAASYRYAKTMPQNPHWYTLRATWADDAAFVEAVQFIRAFGYIERHKGRPYTMYNLNGYKYWTMGAPINKADGSPCTILINRAKIAEPSDYDAIAEEYDAMFIDAASLDENIEVFAQLKPNDRDRVLDIGCGTGLFLGYARNERYVGIDPSAQMLGHLVTRYPEYRDRIYHGRFEEYFDSGGGFDLIVALFGSCNYIDPIAWSEVPKLLRPGGRIFAMFYADGYVPVTYVKSGEKFSHYETSEYDLSKYTQKRHRDTFVICQYSNR
jgi:hypothetical protein